MSACLLSPGPLTMQPMTATLSFSTPGYCARQTGICSRKKLSICCVSSDRNVRVLALTGTIDDAAHDRHLEFFHARILRTPDRHLLAQKVVDLLRQFRSQCPRACSHRDH